MCTTTPKRVAAAGLICGTEVAVERRQVFDRELAGVADTAL
ncbi:hypothetical protein AB0E01_41355 [Nocardia vinacea]